MLKKNKLYGFYNPKLIRVLITGFASGLPLGLLGSTLQAWYTVEQVSIVTIGFLTLVGQPYVYKFIWAPLLDKYQPPFLGLRLGWMLIMQVLLIITLLIMSQCPPSKYSVILAIFAFLLAVFSATQDIAADAFRTEILTAEERGVGAAMSVAGYRLAMLVSGGLSLILAQYIGFSKTYMVMALIYTLLILNTITAPEPIRSKNNFNINAKNKKSFLLPFKDFFAKKSALAIVAFIILYKIGDAFAFTLTTTFLIKELKFNLVDLGLVFKTGGLLATLVGVFFGGWLIPKLGMFRSLLLFGIFQAISNSLFVMLALKGHDYVFMVFTICVENIIGGMGTAAFLAFIMQQCNPNFAATQFALMTAFSAIGRVYVGSVAGIMVTNYGWVNFYMSTVVFALPGVIVLYYLRNVFKDIQEQDKELLLEPGTAVS